MLCRRKSTSRLPFTARLRLLWSYGNRRPASPVKNGLRSAGGGARATCSELDLQRILDLPGALVVLHLAEGLVAVGDAIVRVSSKAPAYGVDGMSEANTAGVAN